MSETRLQTSRDFRGLALGIALLVLAAGTTHAADRALVVGVEKYAHPDVPMTEGSERDARELAKFLQSRLGFAPDSIRLLLNGEATASRIESEFRDWLIQGSSPGDRVFFSYSGHGSKIRRTDGAGEYHNTLAPHDVNPESGANQVLDSTIRDLVNQLAGRRAILLFDSCHSGSIARSIAGGGKRRLGGRYLPPPEEFKALSPGVRLAGGITIGEPAGPRSLSGGRGMFLNTSMTGAASGIIAISAAADHQVAYPIETSEGTVMGALTWSFLAAAGEGKVPFGQIKTKIPEAISRLRESGRLQGQQVPQFDVRTTDDLALETQPLFGSWQTAAATALQNPASTIRLTLRMAPKPKGQPFRAGEIFQFDVDSSAAGFFTLLVFSEGRTASCIIPNALDRNPLITAGKTRFPRKGEEFVVQCEPTPCGKDIAVAILSDKPLRLGEKENYTWEEIFSRLKLKDLEAYLGATAGTRGSGIRNPASLTGWQAATVVFETRK